MTATNSFVTAPIAREFGVTHLIATEPESRDGRFTGRVAGTPCFREGKIARVDAWLSDLGQPLDGFEESAFYSDSHNDLPLLERVSQPGRGRPRPPARRRGRPPRLAGHLAARSEDRPPPVADRRAPAC